VALITLRPATIQDAQVLLEWRNDPETRKNSHTMDEIKMEDHMKWLYGVLSSGGRYLLIAELRESLESEVTAPVGTVRLDLSGDICELSWTVAPL